ncbi:uncharacterized protein [Rutidosis leptorrhynchoides]|uniref:uncharacterized protein n=1 Tax=Rutidosis leptorrhynchoides TaxID=125765 RepID=UPI003A99BE4E
MAGDDDGSSSITLVNKLDFGDPLYLHASDTTGTALVSIKLKGTENYSVWSRAMLLALNTKNKKGFIDGTCKRSDYEKDEVLLNQWDRCNSVQVNSLTQGGSSVSEYYHKLNSLWKQFDALVKLPECVCTANADFIKHNSVMKLMQFLMGLDEVYQPIRSNLLMTDPLPNVKTAFAVISREESHRNFSGHTVGQKSRSSAFVAKTPNNVNGNNNFNRPNNMNNTNQFKRSGTVRGLNANYKCTKCGIIGHTVDRCFEVIGYPPGYIRKPFNQGAPKFTANNNNCVSDNANATTSSSPFTVDQISKLMSLINDKDKGNSTAVLNANMSGSFWNNSSKFNSNFEKFFCNNMFFTNNKHHHKDWIIDSGANQHMICSDGDLFDEIDVSNMNIFVSHPNGTQAKIVKVENIQINEFITLYNVLYIPEYCVNLLSVNKLTVGNRFFVGYNEQHCFIQNLMLNKLVGIGDEKDGLYMFKKMNIGNCANSFCGSLKLWHHRLGHPASQVLVVLKEKLNLKDSNFIEPCEIYHKAKQTREPFPLSENKSVMLGDLLHLDLWGPYKVVSKEGYKYFLTIIDDFTRAVWIFPIKTKDEVFDNVNYLYNIL